METEEQLIRYFLIEDVDIMEAILQNDGRSRYAGSLKPPNRAMQGRLALH